MTFCQREQTLTNNQNIKYEQALQEVLRTRQGCHVMDIGTGTGLLAMMAVRAGAGSVDAFEVSCCWDPLRFACVAQHQPTHAGLRAHGKNCYKGH
jgi:predicted RNA methylase